MKWFLGAFELFWLVQLARDEFAPMEFAARHRIVDLIPHWNLSVWVSITLLFVLATFLEGALRWSGEHVDALVGNVGSLQHEVMDVAISIGSCIATVHRKHGSCPEPTPDDPRSTEQSWLWQGKLSRAFDADVKPRLRNVMAKLEREGIFCVDVQNAISLATITEAQAMYAAIALFQMGMQIKMREAEPNVSKAGFIASPRT